MLKYLDGWLTHSQSQLFWEADGEAGVFSFALLTCAFWPHPHSHEVASIDEVCLSVRADGERSPSWKKTDLACRLR